MRTAVIALGLLFVLFVACGPTSSGAPGISCTASSDCGSGLKCLSDTVLEDGGCVSVGMECVMPCTTTAQCTAALGAGYACSGGPCGASIVTCQPIVPDDGGPEAAASMSDAAHD
jgi:hypothetical protein